MTVMSMASKRSFNAKGLRLVAATAIASALMAVAVPVRAADADPALVRVTTLDDNLVSAARKGELRGGKVRQYIDQAFNLQIMAQIAVGAPWTTMSATERASIVDALSRYTEARYAYEFKDFSGQSIQVDPAVQVRGLDKLVRAEVRQSGEAPLKIGYRLREYGGVWKIIDVIYDGVSQLATQRSDFAEAVASGGARGLVKKLDAATAKLK